MIRKGKDRAFAVEIFSRSEFLAPLGERAWTTLARESRLEICEAGQVLIVNNQPAETSYVLAEGKVVAYVRLRPGRHCGGEGVALLADEGRIFGWGPVARPDRLTTSAWSVDKSTVIAINVTEAPFRGATLRFLRCLAASLLAILQELGLCPLAREDVEHMTEPSAPCGVEECISCHRPAGG
jgi:hypothetical protein